MPRLRRTVLDFRAQLLAAAALLAVLSPARASPRDRWPSELHARLLAGFDSLPASAYRATAARIDSLILAAHARSDSGLEMVLAIRRAGGLGFVENAFERSHALAESWLPFIRARHDTLSWCTALRAEGFADLSRQRMRESGAEYDRMLALARRAHLARVEGYARIGTSYVALEAGRPREAERGYRIAIARLEHAGDSRSLRVARVGLARSLIDQGEIDEARREYERLLAEARAENDAFNAAAAWNDLGAIEYKYGDPARAMACFRSAEAIQRATGNRFGAAATRRNVALCFAVEGNRVAASALMDSLAREYAEIGNPRSRRLSLVDLAELQIADGLRERAESTLLAVLGTGDSLDTEPIWQALPPLADLEATSGRAEAACRRLREALSARGPAPGSYDRSALLEMLAKAELAAGRPADALPPLREVIATDRGRAGLTSEALVREEHLLARAEFALGRPDSALAHEELAMTAWERARTVPSSDDWTPRFDRVGVETFVQIALELLDPARGGSAAERAARAFVVMQRFRGRQLDQALRGVGGRAAPARVSIAALQQKGLRPGEVLLDFYAAPETSVVFAVTAGGLRVSTAPGHDRLEPRLRRLADLLSDPAADAGRTDRALTELGSELLGPHAEVLRRSRVVLVCAGDLASAPIAMLRLPGEPGPLGARREVAYVPSATLLTEGRATARSAAHDGVVALCRAIDSEGRALEGVRNESRWLARRFPHARVRDNDGGRPLGAMLASLGSPEVLHIAAHTRVTPGAPWASGFLLGRGNDDDAYLTAARISQLRSAAPICVLAGCTSAGQVFGPEGMPDLAAAWLAAGARAVIATLWPVDDRATAKFVENFYDALAAGRTAGEAIVEAQRRARASADRASPSDWAGFVVLGDPDTRVNLR